MNWMSGMRLMHWICLLFLALAALPLHPVDGAGSPITPSMWGMRSDEDLWPYLHLRIETPYAFDSDFYSNPSGYAEVPVTVMAWSISGPSKTNLPVVVEGLGEAAEITIDLGADEYDVYTVRLNLSGGKEMVFNPFTPHDAHVDYVMKIDNFERNFIVHAYPDLSYFYLITGALVIVSVVLFYRMRKVRTVNQLLSRPVS